MIKINKLCIINYKIILTNIKYIYLMNKFFKIVIFGQKEKEKKNFNGSQWGQHRDLLTVGRGATPTATCLKFFFSFFFCSKISILRKIIYKL